MSVGSIAAASHTTIHRVSVCLCTTMKLPRPISRIHHGTTGRWGPPLPGAVVTGEKLCVYTPGFLKHSLLLSINSRHLNTTMPTLLQLGARSTVNNQRMSDSCSVCWNWNFLLWFSPGRQRKPAPTFVSLLTPTPCFGKKLLRFRGWAEFN